jgi:hypothetical protein
VATYLKYPRGTRANLTALASASGLVPYSKYWVTDESRFAMATSTTVLVDLPTKAETVLKTDQVALVFHLNGGGAAITAGQQFDLPSIPIGCTVVGWRIVGDQTGSAVIDILRSTYANFPTMSSIAGTEKPTLSSARKNEDTSLTSWTTSLAQGDVLRASVSSATFVTWVTVELLVVRT